MYDTERPRVGIVGGGIGGLALAQGLVRCGFSVVVFDQNVLASETGGYRLHLTEESLRALRRLLPTDLSAAIESSAAPPETFRHLAIFDHRARCRARLTIPREHRLLIGRRPLRELLARGMDGIVRWGARVARVRETEDGVLVETEAGDVEQFDVVVGADGPRSVVTQALLGRPASRPSGVRAIAGTLSLSDHPGLTPPDALERGLGLAIGPAGTGMFLALHRPRPGVTTRGAIVEEPYLVWSVIAQAPAFSGDVIEMRRQLLREEAFSMTRSWAPFYRSIIESTGRESLAAFDFVFPGAMTPWPRSRITLIGDAVHPMPPTAGAGASTAIVDALTLVEGLTSETWPTALQRYRDRMLEYAPRAVDMARPALVWQARLANPLLRWLALTAALPLVDAALKVRPPSPTPLRARS